MNTTACLICGQEYRPGQPIILVDTKEGRRIIHKACLGDFIFQSVEAEVSRTQAKKLVKIGA